MDAPIKTAGVPVNVYCISIVFQPAYKDHLVNKDYAILCFARALVTCFEYNPV